MGFLEFKNCLETQQTQQQEGILDPRILPVESHGILESHGIQSHGICQNPSPKKAAEEAAAAADSSSSSSSSRQQQTAADSKQQQQQK